VLKNFRGKQRYFTSLKLKNARVLKPFADLSLLIFDSSFLGVCNLARTASTRESIEKLA